MSPNLGCCTFEDRVYGKDMRIALPPRATLVMLKETLASWALVHHLLQEILPGYPCGLASQDLYCMTLCAEY
jgi:hypothetical protein